MTRSRRKSVGLSLPRKAGRSMYGSCTSGGNSSEAVCTLLEVPGRLRYDRGTINADELDALLHMQALDMESSMGRVNRNCESGSLEPETGCILYLPAFC
eukprot:2242440-Pyramimonas_sp.AAC.1